MSNHLSWDALNDVVDDALLPDALRAAEAHLADCPTCRAQIASLRTLAQRATNVADSIDPPDDAWRVVRDRISASAKDRSAGAGDAQRVGDRALGGGERRALDRVLRSRTGEDAGVLPGAIVADSEISEEALADQGVETCIACGWWFADVMPGPGDPCCEDCVQR